ncbi:hypothetical protein ACTU6U_08785 [Microbacterium sp. A196]|uniref:hypothetical protein n=1 Tax=Microbacterium sp. A196 TaxID=3457320 RepID=UPI003FD02FBE
MSIRISMPVVSFISAVMALIIIESIILAPLCIVAEPVSDPRRIHGQIARLTPA